MENNINGITLNQQLADLLLIIEDNQGNIDEQDRLITEYISKLEKRDEEYSKGGEGFALKYVIESVCQNKGLDISKVMKVYRSKNNPNREVCDSASVVKALQEELSMSKEDCQELHTSILRTLKETDFSAKVDLLEKMPDGEVRRITPDDVRNLHAHIVQGGYNRITMGTCGRYSDFMSIDGRTICTGNIDRMMRFVNTFNKNHQTNISTKINTFMMYSDFPYILDEYLTAQGKDEGERREIFKDSMMRYVIEVGARYGDSISAVDMFNELIYNPRTAEKTERFAEYELDENGDRIQEGIDEKTGEPIYKEVGYVERKAGWQKYLTLQDLCDIAVVARAVLPNATFTYNDWNWVIPEKRNAMIDIVNRIKKIQEEIQGNGGIHVSDEIRELLDGKGISVGEDGKLAFGTEQTIIDNIGLESHLNTETTPEEYEQMVDDVITRTGLPAEATEADVAYEKDVSDDEESSKEMQQKQVKLFAKIEELVREGKLIGTTIWSLGKASFTDRMYGYITHASKLDGKFRPKIGKREEEISFKQIGKATTNAFSSNPQSAITAIEILEKGVRTQEEIKEGHTQGDE